MGGTGEHHSGEATGGEDMRGVKGIGREGWDGSWRRATGETAVCLVAGLVLAYTCTESLQVEVAAFLGVFAVAAALRVMEGSGAWAQWERDEERGGGKSDCLVSLLSFCTLSKLSAMCRIGTASAVTFAWRERYWAFTIAAASVLLAEASVKRLSVTPMMKSGRHHVWTLVLCSCGLWAVSGGIGGAVSVLLHLAIHEALLRCFPLSFTLSEAFTVAGITSAGALQLWDSLNAPTCVPHATPPILLELLIERAVVYGVITAAVLTAPLLVSLRRHSSHSTAKKWALTCCLYTVLFAWVAVVDYVLMHATGVEPFYWVLFEFTGSSLAYIWLCAFWLIAIGVSVWCLSPEKGRGRVPNILVRKYYHAVAVVMFMPSIFLVPRFTSVAFGAGMAGLLLAEVLRYGRVPPVGILIDTFMSSFTDERDKGPIIVSHLYLLLGCALPLWLSQDGPVHSLGPYAGILVLGAGDAMASFVGLRFGKRRWPGTRKTVAGTVACMAAVVVLAGVLSFGGVVFPSWWAVCVASGLAALLEAFTGQNDNLVLPIFFEALLSLSAATVP